MQENINFLHTLKRYKFQFIFSLLFLGGLYHQIVTSMVMQWYRDPNYSHGFLVPVIAGYFFYKRLNDLKKAHVVPANIGLFIILSGILMLTVGYVGTEYFSMRSSLIVILAGIVLYFFGKEVFKIVLLPLGYLIFAVPLPYIIYDTVTFSLNLFVTKYSVLFLKVIGVPVWREGNIIMLPNVVLEVVDACSGIRSLVSLLALSVAFAYITQNSIIKKIILISSAIPVAIFANGIRVVVTGLIAQNWDTQVAESFFHEFTGITVFSIAIAMLLVNAAIVKKIRI